MGKGLESEAAEGLQRGIQLADAGLRLNRKYLRREYPSAAEEEITRRLNDWLDERWRRKWSDPAFRIRWSAETHGKSSLSN